MEDNRKCRACTIPNKVTEKEINEAIDKLSKLRGMRFVDDDIYQSRLIKCSDCNYLDAGTTCLQCGCIVQIKAKLPESTCPYPRDRKW